METFKVHSESGCELFPYLGVKGETLLSEFVDFPDGVLLDKMHLIDLGIFKRILRIFFDTENKYEPYYLGSFKNIHLLLSCFDSFIFI